jgi:aminoglycoside phosphotransferase (APT) family kinase protein
MQPRADVRHAKRVHLDALAPRFRSDQFVRERIAPLVGELARPLRLGGYSTEIVRAKGTGRLTLCYRFADGPTVYAKAYTDALGPHSYGALRRLHAELGPNGHAVPEPLGFIPEDNMLLMREAPGEPLARMLEAGLTAQALDGIRSAAHWLAALHETTMPSLPIEPSCERVKVFKLADMLAKAAAAHPADAALLLELLQRLRGLAPEDDLLVPTHGQYTPANVFLVPGRVTVVDLDRLCLSDRAKDVAIFLHRTRALAARNGVGERAADLVEWTFLREYCARAGRELPNLPYYACLHALKGLAKRFKDTTPGEPARCAAQSAILPRIEQYLAAPAQPVTGARPRGKEELARWRAPVSRADLVGQYVASAIARGDTGLSCEASLVQDTGTGRLTLRYDFGSECIYAKVYSDALGPHSYEVISRLWTSGFGPASTFRVPEPLTFVEEHNLVVMRGVTGTPLHHVLADPNPAIEPIHAVRQAARWLGQLHRASLRVGDPEPAWDSLKTFRLTVRLIKASAARPEHRDLLLDTVHALRRALNRLPEARPVVQTHGRYHHEHVFLDGETVSVIDFDRSLPADPAKDAAEFLRVLRAAAFRAGRDPEWTDRICAAFADEYLAQVPAAAVSLPFYHAAFVALSYLGLIRKPNATEEGRQALLAFHARELERVLGETA